MAIDLFAANELVTRQNVNNRVSKANSMIVGTSLYSNSSGTSSTIALSDTYTNYDEIKILFAESDYYDTATFYPSFGSTTQIFTLYAYSNGNGIYYHGCLLAFSGTTVTFERQNIGKFLTTNSIEVLSDTATKVYKILGYKY